MNRNTILSITAGVLLAGSLKAAPSVTLSGVATTNATQVILDVYADPGAFRLRSFGVRVLFNASDLALQTADRCDDLWFLAKASGTHSDYATPTEISPGVVRIIGARFDGLNPSDGVNSSRLLLATLVFNRLNANASGFTFALGNPSPFANFVSTEGDHLDAGIAGLTGSVTQRAASVDSDGDGLPDDYEMDVFHSLTTSDGTGDTDGDGVSDADECAAGTDANDPNSNLRLRLSVLPSGDAVLDWDSVLGRIYRVEWSGSLTNFASVAEGIAATPGHNQIAAPGFGQYDRVFYRLSAANPTPGR